MRVFRITKTRYADDLSGAGARLNGGRWNHQGVSVIYTSSSRALAMVEYLVHVPAAMIPKNLCIAAIDVPDEAIPDRVEVSDLPGNWRHYPAPPELAEIGSNWALSGKSLLLQVPSAVVEDEYNVLINPMHSDMSRVTVADAQPHIFDERLVR